MTLLNKYLLRRNIFLLFSLLTVGAGIYVLTDLFQRIDVFLDAGHGVGLILLYFLVKLPLIVSQILPSIFLLALVLQLALMRKSRESMALEAGGVSPAAMLRFVLVYALLWSCLQFAFAQVLAVQGERYSGEIWQSEVKKREAQYYAIEDLWFTSGDYVIHLKQAWPNSEKATGVTIYELTRDGLGLVRSIRAKEAATSGNGWTLSDVEITRPGVFGHYRVPGETLPVHQDLLTFKTFEPKSYPSEMSLTDLWSNIARLEQAGSNVEALRTEFHRRFAYAASLLVMGMLALLINMRTDKLYLAVFYAMLCTFVFYASSSFFGTLGENGKLPPPLAAWSTNALFALVAGWYLLRDMLHTLKHKL
ncbi:MAG: LptF/LptG family permease [Deltaproteobacteria bacterium]|jgi:lipopolysaccharide export system permease protein|nr:LptF/LptG family permease [Deltaproteobacteria bacterium]